METLAHHNGKDLNNFFIFVWKTHGNATNIQVQSTLLPCIQTGDEEEEECVCFTKCLANAGSASCSSLLMFSLSLSGVRPGVRPGVAAPRGVIPPPAWGVMPSWLWPAAGVLLARRVTVRHCIGLRRRRRGRRAAAVLPDWRAEDSVGRLDQLLLRSHTAKVALVQRRVEASFQRRVDVGQRHQVLSFLQTRRWRMIRGNLNQAILCKMWILFVYN